MTDQKITRVCQGKLDRIRVGHCFIHHRLLTDAFQELECSGPSFIGHGDIAPQNILVDDDLNITGYLNAFSHGKNTRLRWN